MKIQYEFEPMTTEEQLKIYAAYLPYGLLIETRTDEEISKEGSYISKLIGVDEIGLTDEFGNFWEFGVRPILYDLSHFEKYFAKLFDEDIDVRTFLNEGFIIEENQFESIIDMINNYKVEWWPYGVIQLALKHHFNIFSIPAGEFIDKATLKTESND